MTPLQLKMLLHYHHMAEPYAVREPEHRHSGAVLEQRHKLIDWGMLNYTPDTPSCFTLTERGKFFIDYICALPLPIATSNWEMPSCPKS